METLKEFHRKENEVERLNGEVEELKVMLSKVHESAKREWKKKDREVSKLNRIIVRIKAKGALSLENARKKSHRKDKSIKDLCGVIDELKAKMKQDRENANIKYDQIYSANYSARKTIKKLKDKKQTVLKAVIALILDDKLIMNDNELEERYFVDIGNIRQTRNTTKRERK